MNRVSGRNASRDRSPGLGHEGTAGSRFVENPLEPVMPGRGRFAARYLGRKLTPEEERQMRADYVFLCGVMWAQYASEDARLEPIRAQRCGDPDVAFLAGAILGRDSTPPSIV